MVEKFNKEFNYDASGAVRNWKAFEDEEFKRYFIQARKTLEDTELALREELCLNYDNEIILSSEDNTQIQQKFLKQANEALEEAFSKKYNRNSL